MKLPAAGWREQPGLARLLEALDARLGATRFVGGCVRDTLLGLPVSDVDLATRLAPADVIARLEKARIKAVPTGIAHGTVTAVVAGRPIEVTTLRRDVATDGRRATIEFTEEWREDAARRDFTINALSAEPASGEVHDPFDGLADLAARRVRFIGDPAERIGEDHLRILRFFRFHARFGTGDPDAAGLAACAKRANDLMALSRERIADELLKLLSLDDPASTIEVMIARGILAPVLPEIAAADALARLVDTERAAGIPGDPIRRLAALLPDDPQASAAVAARLRLSNRRAERLIADSGAEEHDGPQELAYAIGGEAAIDRLLLAGDHEQARGLIGWQKPRMPLSGGALIAMGLEAGPKVARTMRAIEQDWIKAGFPADKATVKEIARKRVDQAIRASANS